MYLNFDGFADFVEEAAAESFDKYLELIARATDRAHSVSCTKE